jgi:hypothetical protein
MIDGFDDYTNALTPGERAWIPALVTGFQLYHIGQAFAVKGCKICSRLNERRQPADPRPDLTDARLRKIVNFMRVKGLVKNLVASSRGYYIEPDPGKRQIYVRSLKERAAAILAVADSFTR